MPAPKDLELHVREATFRARRHRDLLEHAPALPWVELATLQSQYAATEHELERRAIAVEFERAVRELDVDQDEHARRELEQEQFERELAEVDDVDFDADLRRWQRAERALLAQDLRRGILGQPLSYRAIGLRLRCSASTARRLVASLEQPTAV